jgi:hypothetical protein
MGQLARRSGARSAAERESSAARGLLRVGCSAWFGEVVPLAPWSTPEHHLLFLGVEAPYPQPSVGGTHDRTQAFGLRIQLGVSQHTTHKDGHLLGRHLKADQTILRVADLPPIKTTIPREESRPMQVMQEWEDFLILEPLAGGVDTDLPHRNPPTP